MKALKNGKLNMYIILLTFRGDYRMKKQSMHFIQLVFVAIIFTIAGGAFANATKADSANLSDGIYTVPVTLLKSGSSTTSMANHFFDQTANVTVSKGNYKTVLTTNGANYIASMSMGGQSVGPTITSGNNGTLTFNLTNPSNIIPVSFTLYNIPLINTMQESADFSFNWANATKQADLPEDTSTTTDTTPAADSSSATSSSTTSTTTQPATPTTTKTTTTKKSTVPTTTRTYVVLKGDSNSKSMANKYYTRKAVIKKVAKHYNVQLKVAYKKSLKLGSKAVRPVTINGKKVKASTVTYGKSGSNYTMTYSFNIASLKTLKHVIKGSIHVVVPYANISTTWPIRFKFSQSAPAKAHKHAVASAAVINRSSSAQPSQEKLPQTSDTSENGLSFLGFVLAGGLSFVWGNSHEILK